MLQIHDPLPNLKDGFDPHLRKPPPAPRVMDYFYPFPLTKVNSPGDAFLKVSINLEKCRSLPFPTSIELLGFAIRPRPRKRIPASFRFHISSL